MSTIGTNHRSMSGVSLMRTVEWVEQIFERRRTRLALMEMSEAQLKDIGVSRSEAFGEANRPFWK